MLVHLFPFPVLPSPSGPSIFMQAELESNVETEFMSSKPKGTRYLLEPIHFSQFLVTVTNLGFTVFMVAENQC